MYKKYLGNADPARSSGVIRGREGRRQGRIGERGERDERGRGERPGERVSSEAGYHS